MFILDWEWALEALKTFFVFILNLLGFLNKKYPSPFLLSRDSQVLKSFLEGALGHKSLKTVGLEWFAIVIVLFFVNTKFYYLVSFIQSSAEKTTRGGVEDTRLEAKDTKNIQGQGQPFRGQTLSRPRTGMLEAKPKDTGASVLQKKRSSKSFSGDIQFIGVPRIFDWEGLNHKSHAIRSSKIFKRKFLWDKDIVGWKI